MSKSDRSKEHERGDDRERERKKTPEIRWIVVLK
jgi:hypothetical protein